ncbi:MAG: hypothetical protein NT001_02080 [Candidatus Woesearchaeota archaeon]|nr:hypothetical protein [Candidatus Woesearchaeota archaeon]
MNENTNEEISSRCIEMAEKIHKQRHFIDEELESFIFYWNVNSGTSADDVAEEYNSKNPGSQITGADIKFGPRFNDQGDGMRFYWNRHKMPENYGEDAAIVLGELKENDYMSRMAFRTSCSNEYESFSVHGRDLLSMIDNACKEQGWEFEGATIKPNYRECGFLKADGEVYFLVNVSSRWGMAFYNADGSLIDLNDKDRVEKCRIIKSALVVPVNNELNRQEQEFRDYYHMDDEDD